MFVLNKKMHAFYSCLAPHKAINLKTLHTINLSRRLIKKDTTTKSTRQRGRYGEVASLIYSKRGSEILRVWRHYNHNITGKVSADGKCARPTTSRMSKGDNSSTRSSHPGHSSAKPTTKVDAGCCNHPRDMLSQLCRHSSWLSFGSRDQMSTFLRQNYSDATSSPTTFAMGKTTPALATSTMATSVVFGRVQIQLVPRRRRL